MTRSVILCLAAVLMAACSKPPKPVEDLTGHMDVSGYNLTLMKGHRDGDRLTAQAGLSNGSASFLLDLRFTIETGAQLQSGQWKWLGPGGESKSGAVDAKSIMFLGGQNGPPSIGGTYYLLSSDGAPWFRVTIPATPLEVRAPSATH